MTKLNQLLAIERGDTQRAERQLTDAYKAIQRSQLFDGLTRTYQPIDDAGERRPSESKKVQQTVGELVDQIRGPLVKLLDVQLEKDITNQVAVADIVVDGQTILAAVPVTHLLWLEKRVTDFKTFVEKLPMLDSAEDWEYDDHNGVYRTAPATTFSTTKVPEPIVMTPATDKHPAQVHLHTRDVTVGHWSTTKLSGAVEPSRKQGAIERADILLAAIRKAREEANSIEVVSTRKAGESIFDYVFRSLVPESSGFH